METVRYTDEGGRYRTGGVTFEPGDVGEVSAGLAEHLVVDVGSFEYVDEEAIEKTDTDPDEDVDDDASDEGEASDEDDGLVEELDGMTIPEFEEELESGRFDDRLEAVGDAEREGQDRAGVHDAIGVRRAEIEG
ncbi:hypothetical protein [Natrinema soli]|uniref:Uncharacterized protein n=1 Tax=Natrinema soli TaxID=1930624 RepID=A0ABD5SPX8_9EURY|nr:hypothetical protein [Natrinema soli]